MSNFTFIAAPGSQNVTYNVESSHIDYDMIDHLSNTTVNPLQAIGITGFSVNLRYCKPGEYQTGNHE